MKLVAFRRDGSRRLGVVEASHVVDLQAVDPGTPTDTGALLERCGGDLSALADVVKQAPAAAGIPLEEIAYDFPVAAPGAVYCLGLNYLDHAKEGPYRDNIPKFPTIFMRSRHSLVPHEAPILAPSASETLDYEGELIAVVGRRAKHLTLENACDCIAGWSCGNDASVREYQRKTTQWDMGKNFDATGGFGPWLVSADELPRGAKGLMLETRLNGKTMQSASTDTMMFPVAEMLVYLTEGITLYPGDIVFTGTPSGVGHAQKPDPLWMRDGDVCEVEIEGVGLLRNPVVGEG